MKKIVVAILVGMMILSIAGCGGNKDKNSTNNNPNVEQGSDDENKDDQNDNNAVVDNNVTIQNVKNAPETNARVFDYESIDGGISITKYNGDDEIVVIPEQIDGQDVIEIGDSAFGNCQTIKGIKISNKVVKLAKSSFGSCYSLEIVVCGASLEVIDEYAFGSCKALHTIELNDTLKCLEFSSFGGTAALKELYIPASVTTLNNPFIASQTSVTIVVESGSAAEAYANEKGIPCAIK